MKTLISKILLRIYGITLLALVFVTHLCAQEQNGNSFAQGVKLYKAKAYVQAIEEFKKAEKENKENDDAILWHGLALMARGTDLAFVNDATNLWNSQTNWDRKSQAMAQYLGGLGYWRVSYNSTAKLWFGLASTSNNSPAYRLAQAALKSMENNEEVQPIELWATIAGLPETIKANSPSRVTYVQNTTVSSNRETTNKQTSVVTEDADGTVLADRPILKCPVEQKPVKNGTAPDLKVLKKVFRCQAGEKSAAKGMDGAYTIDVESMQIGKPRLMDYLVDKGDGIPGKTLVYPIKVIWTEKTFYRTRTAVSERKIAIINFNINSFGEWQYGSATNISDGTYKSIPRSQ